MRWTVARRVPTKTHSQFTENDLIGIIIATLGITKICCHWKRVWFVVDLHQPENNKTCCMGNICQHSWIVYILRSSLVQTLVDDCAEFIDDSLLSVLCHFCRCVLYILFAFICCSSCRSHPLDNIRVMVMVLRLRGNIIRTALCWTVWHNVRSPQHTYVNSSYRSNTLGLSHWDPYAVRRAGCLELYYCNVVEWFWWDSSLIFDGQLVSFSALTLLVWSSGL